MTNTSFPTIKYQNTPIQWSRGTLVPQGQMRALCYRSPQTSWSLAIIYQVAHAFPIVKVSNNGFVAVVNLMLPQGKRINVAAKALTLEQSVERLCAMVCLQQSHRVQSLDFEQIWRSAA